MGRSAQTATVSLGAASLLFACVFTALLPGSIEQRFFSFLLFGALPALGFYLSGHILNALLTQGATLSEFVCCSCIPRLPSYSRKLVDRAAVPASQAMHWSLEIGAWTQEMLLFTTRKCSPFIYKCWGVKSIILEIVFLLIRNTARLIIAIQRRMPDAKFARRTYLTMKWGSYHFDNWRLGRLIIVKGAYLSALGIGWLAGLYLYHFVQMRNEHSRATEINAVVDRIIQAESSGNPTAKNPRSTATGLGQFVNETWLEMIRADRPDLAKERGESEVLELRRDPGVAREIITRLAERNALALTRRGLPVTPATLYLAHFSGRAGAVAILSAPDDADAAFVMASADRTGRTTREEIIRANPFLEHFTIADLKNWADCKMIAAANCLPNGQRHWSPALDSRNRGLPLAWDLR